MARPKRRIFKEEEKEWIPKTSLGKRVMGKDIISIDQVFEMGKPILEHQIVDMLLPNLKDEVLDVSMTQRMTDCGRKVQFRAIIIVGDLDGHVGIGVGKADETRPAIQSGLRNAKRNMIKVPLGCGSWECGCGERHTVPIKTVGHNGSVKVTLKPAPRGVGIVSNDIVKKVLSFAGVKDVWTFSRGKTSNIYNSAMAVYNALDSLNRMKFRGSWEPERIPEPAPVAGKEEGKTEKPAKPEEAAKPEPGAEKPKEEPAPASTEEKQGAEKKGPKEKPKLAEKPAKKKQKKEKADG